MTTCGGVLPESRQWALHRLGDWRRHPRLTVYAHETKEDTTNEILAELAKLLRTEVKTIYPKISITIHKIG